jgi:hypothetical protein
MFNAGHSEQNSGSGKRSLAEWLRMVKRDLFQSPPQEVSGPEASWYAGLAVAPGVIGEKDAAGFTGQISRLQKVLDRAGDAAAKTRRAEGNMRQPSHVMVRPNRAPPDADSSASL